MARQLTAWEACIHRQKREEGLALLGVGRFERFYGLVGIFNLRHRRWLGDRGQMVVVGSVTSLLEIAEGSGYVGDGRLLEGFHD